MYDIGIRSAAGFMLWNQFRTTSTPTAIYQLEGPKAEHGRRMRALLDSAFSWKPGAQDCGELQPIWDKLGDECEPLLRVRYAPMLDLTSRRNLERICSMIKHDGIEFLLFDNLLGLFPGDENSSEWVGQIKRACDMLRAAQPCTLLFIHFPRKRSSDYRLNDPLEMIRGHSSLRALPDHVFHLERKDRELPDVTFSVIKHRGGIKPPPIALRFHGTESPAGAGFENLGQVERKSPSESGAARAVITALGAPGHRRYLQDLVRELPDLSEDSIRRTIKMLSRGGRIEKGARDAKGIPVWLTDTNLFDGGAE
jgi:hypothetical protein